MTDSAYQRMVLGYHGCNRETGEAVLLRGRGLEPSDNDWDWLGRGIYFWEYGVDRAWQWAESKYGDDAYVIGAYINLGRCFDLTDTAHTGALKTFYDRLETSIGNEALPANEPGHGRDRDFVKRHLDCAVINLGMAMQDDVAREKEMALASNGVYYQSVRGIFMEGNPAFRVR